MKKPVSLLCQGISHYMVVNLATGHVSKHDYTVKRLVHAYHIRPYHVSLLPDRNTAIVEGIQLG